MAVKISELQTTVQELDKEVAYIRSSIAIEIPKLREKISQLELEQQLPKVSKSWYKFW